MTIFINYMYVILLFHLSSGCKRSRHEDDGNPIAEASSSSSPSPSGHPIHSNTPMTSPTTPPLTSQLHQHLHNQQSSSSKNNSDLSVLPQCSLSPSLPPPPPLNSNSPPTSMASPPSAATPPPSGVDLISPGRDLSNNATCRDLLNQSSDRETCEINTQNIKMDRQSPAGSNADSTLPVSAIDTLIRLFPGRRVAVLEAVLLHCGSDVLRAIQTLLYSAPMEHNSSNTNGSLQSVVNGLESPISTLHNRINSHRMPMNGNHNHRSRTPPSQLHLPPQSQQRSPEPQRPYDFFQDPNGMLRAPPFNPLTQSTLGRFPYSPHHAFLGLPYSPFLTHRPEYYPPLNLSAHQPSVPPPLSPSSVHSTYPNMPRSSASPGTHDQSPSPSSLQDPDSD